MSERIDVQEISVPCGYVIVSKSELSYLAGVAVGLLSQSPGSDSVEGLVNGCLSISHEAKRTIWVPVPNDGVIFFEDPNIERGEK